MGYEIKLYVGKSSFTEREYSRSATPEIDGCEVYYQYIKTDRGDFIETGKRKTYFQVMAMIDLCKPGYSSEISNISKKNEDENHYWYFFIGNKEVTEDYYGDKFIPVKLNDVLDALKNDYEKEEYRRFKWAIALLDSMKDDQQDLEVIFFGH